jgi:hypothetical protein
VLLFSFRLTRPSNSAADAIMVAGGSPGMRLPAFW